MKRAGRPQSYWREYFLISPRMVAVGTRFFANGGGRRGDGAETCVGAAPSSRSANHAAVVVLADRFAGGMPERRGEAREARGRCAREACGVDSAAYRAILQ